MGMAIPNKPERIDKKPPTSSGPVKRIVSRDEFDSTKILPCPFCGHGAKCSALENKGYEATRIHFLYCENEKCGARVFQPDKDFDSAVKAWNKRIK